MKKKFLFFIFLSFLNQANAMEEKELRENAGNFKNTPKVLILEVSKFLHGKDFFRFSRTCKYIKNTLLQHSKAFMPEEEEKILEVIENTPFHQIQHLLLDWERADKSKRIPLLSGLKDKFLDFYPTNENVNLEPYEHNFQITLKVLNLLYGMGDVKCVELYKNIYNDTHRKLIVSKGSHEEDDVFDQPNLYIFYYKNFTLLNSKIRKKLWNDHQSNPTSFTKDFLKVSEWLKLFDLILCENVFQK